MYILIQFLVLLNYICDHIVVNNIVYNSILVAIDKTWRVCHAYAISQLCSHDISINMCVCVCACVCARTVNLLYMLVGSFLQIYPVGQSIWYWDLPVIALHASSVYSCGENLPTMKAYETICIAYSKSFKDVFYFVFQKLHIQGKTMGNNFKAQSIHFWFVNWSVSKLSYSRNVFYHNRSHDTSMWSQTSQWHVWVLLLHQIWA